MALEGIWIWNSKATYLNGYAKNRNGTLLDIFLRCKKYTDFLSLSGHQQNIKGIISSSLFRTQPTKTQCSNDLSSVSSFFSTCFFFDVHIKRINNHIKSHITSSYFPIITWCGITDDNIICNACTFIIAIIASSVGKICFIHAFWQKVSSFKATMSCYVVLKIKRKCILKNIVCLSRCVRI